MSEIRDLENERRLLIFLPALLLIAIFMAFVVKSVSGNKEEMDRTLFAHLANDFMVFATMIRTEWMITGRLDSLEYQDTLFEMSERGYPLLRNIDGSLDCEQIWRAMMAMDLELNQTPIAVVTVNDRVNHELWCRYQLYDGAYFDYGPWAGKLNFTDKAE